MSLLSYCIDTSYCFCLLNCLLLFFLLSSVISMDSVPLQTMEGEVSESASVVVEEEAVAAAGEEPKEGTLPTVAGIVAAVFQRHELKCML